LVIPDDSREIQAMLRDVIDSNRYMTLGTTERDGLPLNAIARQVPESELPAACAIAFQLLGPGARAFDPNELMSPERLRLYRATGVHCAVHIRGSDLKYGSGVDTRLPVSLPAGSDP
jgi:hypothetical protein